MARTIHGNLTGAAASTELADQREWLRSLPEREARKNRSRFDELQAQMAELMGEDEFNTWYDNDHNIPQWIDWRRMDAIFAKMEAAIETLKRAGRSAAPERPASNEPGQSDKAENTADPIDCITSRGKS